MKLESIIDKTLNLIFSKDKTIMYLVLIFLLGVILRLINVYTIPVSVDASGHALMAINFIESGKLATWNQSVGLWHFLTDIAYRIFGINDLSSRIVALIFGSFSIILMFLFVNHFFNRRAGLIAAFLLAVSPFHITETVPEMDVAALFFALLSLYLIFLGFKEKRSIHFILSGIFLGIGILIKIYVLLFIPMILLYLIYYYKKYPSEKKSISKNGIYFLIFSCLFLIVPVAYNYLLYTDKGFVDYLFTGVLGIGKDISDKYYSWVVPYRHEYLEFFIGGSKIVNSILPGFIYHLNILKTADILILIAGLLGILLCFKRENKDYLWLSLFAFVTVYFYIGSITDLMMKHFLFLLIFFIPFASIAIEKLSCKINIRIILAIILIFQIFWIYNYTNGDYFEFSGYNSLNSFKSNIPSDSLVVVDGRIFRGQSTFVFSDKHYLEANYFGELMNKQKEIPGNVIRTKVYYIECATDDCGWGTIKDQPEFNKTMEELTAYFKNNSELIKQINSKNGFSFNIYETEFNLKPGTLRMADTTHIFWANPLGYDTSIAPVFDNYDIKNLQGNLINKISHLILYLGVIFSFISVIFIIYYLIKQNETFNNNSCI